MIAEHIWHNVPWSSATHAVLGDWLSNAGGSGKVRTSCTPASQINAQGGDEFVIRVYSQGDFICV